MGIVSSLYASNRGIIRVAACYNYDALCNGIKEKYNCATVDIDEIDGNVWIESPMSGHWINDDGLAEIANALRRGDI